MRLCSFLYAGLLFTILSTLGGCARIPERNPSEHFSYFQNFSETQTDLKPIKSLYLDRADKDPQAHHLLLLNIGDDALLARIHLIRAATESIDIQTFIWKDDEVTRLLFNECLSAARRGVRVRLLVDALNPITGNTRLAEMALAHPNFEIAVFRPLSYYTEAPTLNALENLVFKMRRLNRRMHNKLLLVDDKVGIVGGRNYETKYYDRHPLIIFKDRDVLTIGPSVAEMARMFESFWIHEDSVYLTQFKDVKARIPDVSPSETPILQPQDRQSMLDILALAQRDDPGETRDQMQLQKVVHTQFYWDGPQKFHWGSYSQDDAFSDKMMEVLGNAEERIIFQTPYLIYQRENKKNLSKLRKQVPDLQVWVSSNSLAAADHDFVYGVSYKNRKKLYKNMGLEIFEFSPYPVDLIHMVPRYPDLIGFTGEDIVKALNQHIWFPFLARGPKLTLHAKTYVVDGKITQIGSHNFDPRSAALNSECGLIIYDEAFAQQVREDILRDTAQGNSWVVAKRIEKDNPVTYISGVIESLSNMLPIFDIWPYHYTSNYQLKPGYAPLPSSRHPDFYEHYEDIGQFPLIRKTFGAVRARLVKVFGGWTGSFM